MQDESVGLPAQLHQAWLEKSSGRRSNDTANFSAAREVDLPDMRMCDQSFSDIGGICWTVEDELQSSSRETCFMEDIGDGIVAARGELGAFQNDGITSCERESEGS